MAFSLAGAARVLSPSAAPVAATRATPDRTRKTRQRWLADREAGLDDRVLRDIGLSRADLAALSL